MERKTEETREGEEMKRKKEIGEETRKEGKITRWEDKQKK